MAETSSARRTEASMLVLRASMGALVGATICWIVWCLSTGGDYMGGAKSIVFATLAAAAGAGGYAGSKLRSKMTLVALGLVALGSAAFWIFVPDGWWALPPPRPSEIRTP